MLWKLLFNSLKVFIKCTTYFKIRIQRLNLKAKAKQIAKIKTFFFCRCFKSCMGNFLCLKSIIILLNVIYFKKGYPFWLLLRSGCHVESLRDTHSTQGVFLNREYACLVAHVCRASCFRSESRILPGIRKTKCGTG